MKKTNKIISLACSLLLALNFLTVISVAGGTGTEADPFIITTAEELQNINNNVSAHYILGNDIDLTGVDFVPLGNADSGAFSGSFDGNGFTIKNLDVFSGKFAGLFGSNEGTIKNVILENIYVYGTRYIGGVVSYNTVFGTVENCEVLSGIMETDGGINNIQIGGICGRNEGTFNGNFSNGAEVNATVSGVRIYAGGICGYWNSTITEELKNLYNTGNISSSDSDSDCYCFSSGLVGYAYSTVTISNSYNTGNVSSTYSYSSFCYSGGLVGYAYSGVTISNSYNTGNVSSTSSYSSSSCYSGGLVGYAYSTVTISNSYNTGNISSSYSSSGGLVGYAYSGVTISNSYNTGNISSSVYYSGGLVGYAYSTVTISSSYNTGNVSSSSSSSYSSSGGLVGYACSTVIISNSYNTGNVSSTFSPSSWSYSGGLVGYAYSGVTISNSYNTGNVSSTSSYSSSFCYSGGLVGYARSSVTISSSYNTGNVSSSSYYEHYSGGLVGYADSINCGSSYSISGSVVKGSVSSGVNGITLSWNDMKNISSYTGWNFEELWSIGGNCNYAYPVLRDTTSLLTIDISNKIMTSSETIQLTAYKNGVRTTDVKWSITNGSGSVSSTGLVSPGLGLVTVTATDSEGNKANFNAYVVSIASSITATDRTINMAESSTSNVGYFTVTGGTDYVIDYKSSDTNVLKVDGAGNLTPVKAGTATITATTAGGLSATQKVTVIDVATSISLPSTLTVTMGSTKKLIATTSPSPTSSAITWKSSDTTVATVDSEGNVTGLKIGSATITATTDNGLSSNCVVTVNAPLIEMAFETPKLTLYKGQTYKLKLNINPTNTTDTITYSSSSSSRATVSSAGTVTVGTSTGTVTITATSSSGKKATCEITVKDWPSVLTVVDSGATISKDVITTGTTGIRNLDKLVKVKDGYTLDVTYSHTTNGLNYCGTGTVIDVYDDYGNFVISYTLIVNGDVNGDSLCNVLDVSDTERMSTDALTFSAPQAYAANGATKETIDATSLQYVLNKALAE